MGAAGARAQDTHRPRIFGPREHGRVTKEWTAVQPRHLQGPPTGGRRCELGIHSSAPRTPEGPPQCPAQYKLLGSAAACRCHAQGAAHACWCHAQGAAPRCRFPRAPGGRPGLQTGVALALPLHASHRPQPTRQVPGSSMHGQLATCICRSGWGGQILCLPLRSGCSMRREERQGGAILFSPSL